MVRFPCDRGGGGGLAAKISVGLIDKTKVGLGWNWFQGWGYLMASLFVWWCLIQFLLFSLF